jgi:hypothetical protein
MRSTALPFGLQLRGPAPEVQNVYQHFRATCPHTVENEENLVEEHDFVQIQFLPVNPDLCLEDISEMLDVLTQGTRVKGVVCGGQSQCV